MSEFSEEELYGAIARGWCDERNSDKEFDANLADAIAIEVLAVVRPLYTQNKQLKASVGFIEGTIEEAKNVPCWVNMPAKEYDALIARIAKLEKVAEAAKIALKEAIEDCRYHDEYGEGRGLYMMVTTCERCRYWEREHLCATRLGFAALAELEGE